MDSMRVGSNDFSREPPDVTIHPFMKREADKDPGRAAGLVVAPQSEAAYEGARVLAAGGNAADALVTAALVQGVTDPHRSGLGGFGCATVYWSGGAREAGRGVAL